MLFFFKKAKLENVKLFINVISFSGYRNLTGTGLNKKGKFIFRIWASHIETTERNASGPQG